MGVDLPSLSLGPDFAAVSIAAGENLSCALSNQGRVKCWGRGGYIGIGDWDTRGTGPSSMGSNLTYINLGTGVNVTTIYARTAHACDITTDGFVKCWGVGGAALGYGDVGVRGSSPSQMGNNLA